MYLSTLPSSGILSRGSFLLTTVLYLSRGLYSSLQSVQRNPPLTPVIHIEDGPIQGKISMSRNGAKFWEFLSIPYAEPPVGRLRFQPPVPWKEPWQEVRKSIKMPPACVQFEGVITHRTVGVEDCLFLNVFTPPLNKDVSEAKKAVIVYFHPGGYLEGEATLYHPTYLMDYTVVVVVCQFRLGPLGFLNFQESGSNRSAYPGGNMGLKDQNLVLKWVQRNIVHFGGDPKRVTLMGDSAGTSSVNFHMISPLSQGLFHKAIGTSGSILSPWAFTGNARKIAEKYAVRLGCDPRDIMNSSDGLLECYQNKKASELVKYQQSWGNPLVEKDTFVPSVEVGEVTENNFLSESPMDVVKRYGEGSNIAKVPVMFGVMSGEGTPRSAKFEAYPELLPRLDRDWDNQIGRFIIWDEDSMTPEIARKIRNFYFDGANRDGNLVEVMKRLTWLSGDAMFVAPVQTMAMLHAKYTEAPTYLFLYNYSSNFIPGGYSLLRSTRLDDGWRTVPKFLSNLVGNWFEEKVFGWGRRRGSRIAMRRKEVYGVGHGESTQMLWNPFRLIGGLVEGDRKFSEDFVRAIVGFAMEKDERVQPSFRGLQWPSLNKSNLDKIPYMVLDNEVVPKVITEPFSERVNFWENILLRRK